MNAKFLEDLIVYRAKRRLEFTKSIISKKIKNQYALLQRHAQGKVFVDKINKSQTTQEIILLEAQAARIYWHTLVGLCETKIDWKGRKAHRKDPGNILFDIAYHYLVTKLNQMCSEIGLPTELGFFHKAQGKEVDPFIYDFMEWLRPMVDKIVFTHIRKKKKYIDKVSNNEAAVIVYKIKTGFKKTYYHRKLGYCVSLEYWTKLLLLNFMKSVRNNIQYKPLFPSMRHENRCKIKSHNL